MTEMKQEVKFDRSQGIGGSDATRLYEGDWYQVWSEKVGETPSADLSDVLPVQMGVHTESFNIDWFKKQTANVVTRQQEFIQMKKYPYIYAHIDGVVQSDLEMGKHVELGLLECKHTNAFSNPTKVTDKYMAQIQHYLMVAELEKAYLSVFFGNLKYEVIEIEHSIDFQRKLIAAEVLFWHYVKTKQAPPEMITWDTFKPIGQKLDGQNKELVPLLSRI